MKNYSYLFPGGRTKALTFSYDDGVIADRRLIEIFRENGLKGTFNLNGASLCADKVSCWARYPQTRVRHVDATEVPEIYEGMEVAGHGLQHLCMEDLNDTEITDEVHRDRTKLEAVTGYPVKGYAYAFGRYNARVVERLRGMGVAYARTVVPTHGFGLPAEFLTWHPTVHHDDEQILPLTDRFLGLPDDSGFSLFYIWGHSYEFEAKNNWEHMEDVCRRLGNRDEIWYAANIEVYDYVQSLKGLRTSADGNLIQNLSCTDVWLLKTETKEKICVPAGKLVRL